MTTLRARMAQRDAATFVGRETELEWFDRVWQHDVERRVVHVVHVVGAGGIGKSALVREAERRAESHGVTTIWIDGREVAPFPQQIEHTLADVVDGSPAMVVFDSYELISSLDTYIRDVVIPGLPAATLVVVVSRHPPSRGWFEHGWDAVAHTMRLDPLPRPAIEQLARAHGATADETEALVRRSHGSPLAVVVGAGRDPTASIADLAARLLGDEHDPAHHRVVSVASIAKITTPEMLAEVLDDADAQQSFKWLASRSFADPLATGVALHALVADAVRAALRDQDPAGEAELRRRIADHLHRRAVAGHRGLSTELQHLVVDPEVRWGFSGDVGSRFHIDQVRPGDTDVIGAILEAVGAEEWWSITEPLLDQAPEYCGVARTAEGEVGGYFVAVAPGSAPPIAEHDPLLGPWLRYAREVLRTPRAVIWRDAVDLTGEMGEVTSLLGAGGLLSTGVASPRYGFLPITPVLPAALQFSEALGASRVPELDVITHGQHLECHLVDFGPRGLLGFQRDWIYRETGAVPPGDEWIVDPVEVVKLLREPETLARGPAFLGVSPSARLDRLRGLVTDALAVFGTHRDDVLAREIVVAAYLGDNPSHEAIARQLHLSRSAYYRRLHTATQRVSEELSAILRGDR